MTPQLCAPSPPPLSTQATRLCLFSAFVTTAQCFTYLPTHPVIPPTAVHPSVCLSVELKPATHFNKLSHHPHSHSRSLGHPASLLPGRLWA